MFEMLTISLGYTFILFNVILRLSYPLSIRWSDNWAMSYSQSFIFNNWKPHHTFQEVLIPLPDVYVWCCELFSLSLLNDGNKYARWWFEILMIVIYCFPVSDKPEERGQAGRQTQEEEWRGSRVFHIFIKKNYLLEAVYEI